MKNFYLVLMLAFALLGCQTGDTLTASSSAVDAAIDKSQDVNRWPALSSPQLSSDEDNQFIEALIGKMTLEEKVGQILQAEIQSLQPGDVKKFNLGSVLNGGGSLPYRKMDATPADWVKLADEIYLESIDQADGGVGIPIIWGTDAVHGHNNLAGATIFPHNIGLGATHNQSLVKKIGEATAKEVRATGIDWVFAPTIAVAQNDLWGRTYESYSENPEIVKNYSAAMVEGLQGSIGSTHFLEGEHVIACAKHFLGDGGTYGGDDQGDARVNERTLIAIHNAGYPPAINAGVQTVMASFSAWNGNKMHGNKYLLSDVLKGRMGFDGLVVGDWNGHGQVPGCTNESCAAAINAGVDLVMVPYDWRAMYVNTLEQVRSGEITLARLEDAVRRILRVKLRGGLFKGKPSTRIPKTLVHSVGSAEHRALAREAVRESLVLLKNQNNILPINPTQSVLVAGKGANNIPMQIGGWSITWQGTGTTNENFPTATSIFKGIENRVIASGGKVSLSEDGEFIKAPDVAIVIFGEEPYAEGHGDRETLEFEPGDKKSLALLKKLKAKNIPTVAVFLSGRPMWVNPEINAANAFVAAWLPGSEGSGIADVLFSKKDGSVDFDFKGTLSFSWPATPLQSEINGPTYATIPLFKLGYGLSYQKPGRVKTLPEALPGVKVNGEGDILFYNGRPLQPWNTFIRNRDKEQMLSGSFASLPEGDVKIQAVDKDVQEDALRFRWTNTWSAGLQFKNGNPLNLERFVDGGVVAFDLNILSFSRTSLNVELICGDDCRRRVSLVDYAKQNLGKGWNNLRIDLSCFKREGDKFDAVPQPFNLDAGGTGELEVANIRFLVGGKSNFDCPDYTAVSTTPVPNTEYWALDWWMPRHNAILEQIKNNPFDLLMIGDSITQGWEDQGKKVWQKYYAPRKALNLGFSGDRTEHLLWRLQHGEVEGLTPKVAVLMIGTNNTGHRLENPELTVKGIKAVLAELTARLPKTKILLLAVFPRDEQPGMQMRMINNAINQKLEGLADGQRVHFLDISSAFLTPSGVLEKGIMPDLLHPNERGYELWASAMEKKLKELMQ